MLYLQKSKTKIYLIFLLVLFFLNLAFLASKGFTSNTNTNNQGSIEITNASEEQYQSVLNSFYELKDQIEFIKNTKTTYLYIFPEDCLVIIYFGYFLIMTLFILSIKFNLNESTQN